MRKHPELSAAPDTTADSEVRSSLSHQTDQAVGDGQNPSPAESGHLHRDLDLHSRSEPQDLTLVDDTIHVEDNVENVSQRNRNALDASRSPGVNNADFSMFDNMLNDMSYDLLAVPSQLGAGRLDQSDSSALANFDFGQFHKDGRSQLLVGSYPTISCPKPSVGVAFVSPRVEPRFSGTNEAKAVTTLQLQQPLSFLNFSITESKRMELIDDVQEYLSLVSS